MTPQIAGFFIMGEGALITPEKRGCDITVYSECQREVLIFTIGDSRSLSNR